METALACLLWFECLLSSALQTNTEATAQTRIIADNLLLCIAFSKDGSTVYLMLTEKQD